MEQPNPSSPDNNSTPPASQPTPPAADSQTPAPEPPTASPEPPAAAPPPPEPPAATPPPPPPASPPPPATPDQPPAAAPGEPIKKSGGWKKWLGIPVVLLVVAAGYYVVSSRAATTAPAATTASTAKPAYCAKGGTQLWSNLATCGWPTASNTGPTLANCPGKKLTTNSGSLTRTITISKAGTVLKCENITGQIRVTAKNVTIQDVSISGSSGKTGTAANGTAVIFINDGASATINRVYINGNAKEHACIWHQGSSMTANAVNCTAIDDGIFSWASSKTAGDNFAIKNSYFHGLTTATANGHEDGYQTEGAANGTISHNTYQMTAGADSAIAIWDSLKSSSNITVSNNLITGGGFSIYAEDYSPSEANPKGGFTETNIHFNNNSFSTHAGKCVGNFGVWFTRTNLLYQGGPTDGWHRSGNKILETGKSVDGGNPPGCS